MNNPRRSAARSGNPARRAAVVEQPPGQTPTEAVPEDAPDTEKPKKSGKAPKPARRAPATQTILEDGALDPDAPWRLPRIKWVPGIFIAGISLLHATATPIVATVAEDFILTMVWVLLPAMLTWLWLPGSRKHGYQRWIVVAFLPNIVAGLWTLPVLAVAMTWTLYRFWVIEHPGQTVFAKWIAKGRAIENAVEKERAARERKDARSRARMKK